MEFVDDPAAAHEIVRVHIGSSRTDKAAAKRLAKACLEEQERQRRGESDKGVFDRLVDDLQAPQLKPAENRSPDGMRFRTALALAALTWIGLSLFVAREDGFGVGIVALFLGVAMAPAVAMVFKVMDWFIPEGLVGLAALGLCGLVWAAAFGIVDVPDRRPRDADRDRSGSRPARAAASSTPLAAGGVDRSVETGSEVSSGPEPDGEWSTGDEAYTVIVASKPERERAAAFAERAPSWARPAGVLRSDAYTTLLPGYWVAFVGRMPTAAAALRAAERLRAAGFDGAFAELISRRPQVPGGAITPTTVGSLRVGMSIAEVRRYLTPPDLRRQVNFSAGPAPEVDWTWRLGDGDLTLQFDRATGRLTSFESTTAELSTVSGLSVGDSPGPLWHRYGDQIRRSPLDGALMLSEGRPGTYPALMISAKDGSIEAIVGGLPRPAGE